MRQAAAVPRRLVGNSAGTIDETPDLTVQQELELVLIQFLAPPVSEISIFGRNVTCGQSESARFFADACGNVKKLCTIWTRPLYYLTVKLDPKQ